MDPEKLGVVVPPKEGEPVPVPPAPKQGEGTPEGQKPEEKKPETPPKEGSTTPKEGDGTGKPQGQPHQPESKRINDLMSKWQGEQSAHTRTAKELDVAKQLIETLKANIGGGKPGEEKEVPSFMKSGWKPETFEDLQKALVEAKEWGKKEIIEQFENKERTKQGAEQQIESFMTFLKQNDPEFNSDDFEEYVNEHDFPITRIEDLGPIYSSFVSIREKVKEAQRQAKENIQGRTGDKTHVPGASGEPTGLMTGNEISQHRDSRSVAQEMLRKLKGL